MSTTPKTLKVRIKVRSDTFQHFKDSNPVLLKGEIGFEFDSNRIKIGDGTKTWQDLDYIGNIAVARNSEPTTSVTDLPIGAIWINTTNNSVYICRGIDESNGNASWIHLPGDSDLATLSNTIDNIINGTTPVAKANKLTNARKISLSGDASGSISFDGSADKTITVVLTNSGVTAGTYTKLTVDAKGRVTAATNLTASDIPELTLDKITDAGTAAAKNVGTAAGQVPLIGSDGKLPEGILPKIAITEPFAVATETAMLALNAQVGDIAIRSDISKSFILSKAPASTKVNWLELKSPTPNVLSVNGKTGVVVLTTTDITEGTNKYYTEARATANFNTNFPNKSFKDLADGTKIVSEDDVLILDGGDSQN